jgi:hypothetical protein
MRSTHFLEINLIAVFCLMVAGCNLGVDSADEAVVTLNTAAPSEIVVIPTSADITPSETPITLNPTSMPAATFAPTENIVYSDNGNCTIPDGWVSYTIVSGDTLFGISQRHQTTVDTIVSVNCLDDANQISVNQVLYVPEIAGSEIPTSSNTETYHPVMDREPGNRVVQFDEYTITVTNDGCSGTGRAIECRGGLVITDSAGVPINEFQTPQRASSLAVRGNLLYVMSSSVDMLDADCAFADSGIQVLDLSDVTNPVEVTRLSINGWALDMVLYGNYVFLATSCGVKAFDISSSIPNHVGTYSEDSGFPWALIVDGSKLYVKWSYLWTEREGVNELRVLDISNPANPVRQ